MGVFSDDEGVEIASLTGAGFVESNPSRLSQSQSDSGKEPAFEREIRGTEAGSKVITARGTEDGLVIRIDGRAEWDEIRRDLEEFLGDKRKFFEGGGVAVEWLDRLPTKEQSADLERLLNDQYGIGIISKKRRGAHLQQRISQAGESPRSIKGGGVTISLFDVAEGEERGTASGEDFSHAELTRTLQQTVEVTSSRDRKGKSDSLGTENRSDELTQKYVHRMARVLGEDVFYDEDANAKVVFGTLRSGQRVETPFSLVVVGDVNPGADLVAGGDILVLGSLRGTAHAAAYDEDSVDRVIIALHMQPMQLRIGSVISRGSDERVRGVEIAHIEDRRIVVETFHTKLLSSKRKTN